jgi:hypothetical protein|nr:MAG TPA: hypothetical protein [Caudoviricetes sp.]
MKIEILKDSIPYITDVTIAGETYQFEFIYNSYDNRIYINLYDINNDLIYPNEPILFGIPLWFNKLVDEKGNFNKKFPKRYIVPNTLDRNIEKIGFNNINKIELVVLEDE